MSQPLRIRAIGNLLQMRCMVKEWVGPKCTSEGLGIRYSIRYLEFYMNYIYIICFKLKKIVKSLQMKNNFCFYVINLQWN